MIFFISFRKSFFLLTAVFSNFFLNGQNDPISFQHLTTKNGLSSQNYNYYLYKDKSGFIWISSNDGINKFDGQQIHQYKHDPRDTTSIINNISPLSNFFEDKSGSLWFSVSDGLQRYDSLKDAFDFLTISNKGKEKLGAYYLLEIDSTNNDFWLRINDSLFVIKEESFDDPFFVGNFDLNINSKLVITQEKGINLLYTPLNQGLEVIQIKNYQILQKDTFLNELSINAIYPSEDSILLLGTEEGFAHLNTKNQKLDRFFVFESDSLKSVNALVQIDSSIFLVGTRSNGIFYFDKKKQQLIARLSEFDGLEISLFLLPIDQLFYDKDNTLWISTQGRGIFYAKLRKNRIKATLQKKVNQSANNSYIRSVTQDNKQNYWCLSLNGISRLHKDERLMESSIFQGKKVPFFNGQPYSINYIQQKILVCDETGLYQLSPNRISFEKITINGISEETPISFIHTKELSQGTLITSTTKGIFKYDSTSKELKFINGFTNLQNGFTWIEEFNVNNQILLREQQNSFLIGHLTKDYFHLDTTLQFEPFVNFLYKDSLNQKCWLATTEGLYSLNYFNNKYEIEKDTILPFQSIIGVLKEDNSDNLWLSTNKGIVRYNPKLGKWRVFHLSDGLQSQEFNFFASYKSKSGKLMFGGVNGLNIFDPKEIKDDSTKVNPIITSILVNDEQPKEKLKCEKTEATNVSFIKELELPFNENTLSFRFAALDYVNPDANQFKYRMLGVDNDWVQSETENFARYPNLSPGQYTFEVDATNADGIWSKQPAQLTLIICAPIYKTWQAYLAYLLLGSLAIYGLYTLQLNRRLAEAEAKRLKELDQTKATLYTNITHEFRSPLTVILGMAKEVKDNPKEYYSEGLQLIERNGQNLLNLVNQLLNLAKLESGHLNVNYLQGDILAYIDHLVASFQIYAATKGINLTFDRPTENLFMDIDPEKLASIMTNLIGNALKFTHEEGEILVETTLIKASTQSFCQIKIKDDGIGMPKEALPFIFDRFKQIDDSSTRQAEGTGIGLALTHQLVTLLNGSIAVNSELGKGSEFIIELPITTKAKKMEDTFKINTILPVHIPNPFVNEKDNLPILLIIEDNLDILAFLRISLEQSYEIEVATNGEEGVNKAKEIIPDLIISDIMMPKKDGYQVCRELRQDKMTRPIPIILLTAKTGVKARIVGLEQDADVYLEKPFEPQELKVQINRLLKQRAMLQDYYLNYQDNPKPDKALDPLLVEIISLVKEALPTSLTASSLAAHFFISPETLRRKINQLTSIPTTDYITEIRLTEAAKLLKTTNEKISRVAFLTGFKQAEHFTKQFKKRYKQTPSSYRKTPKRGN